MSAAHHQQIYLNTEQLLARYGRKDQSWVWRAVKRGALPAPDFYLAGRKYWSLSAIEANERKARETPLPTAVAA
jgi:hypothetical protein